MLIAHGGFLCPMELLALLPVLGTLWSTRSLWLAKLRL